MASSSASGSVSVPGPRPPGELRVPIVGLGGALSRKLLEKCLGPEVTLETGAEELVLIVPAETAARFRDPALLFMNLNTPEDLARARALWPGT